LEELMRPKRAFLDGEDDFGDDALGRKDAPPKVLNVGDCLYPLFCLPTYEHAWMSAGFGVWGKEEWIKEFWTVLDWRKVSKTYDDILNRSL
jgi:Fe-Mn family superoxide dismutase